MNTPLNINQTKDLPNDQLHKLWRKHFRHRTPPRLKSLLWQELAYKIQTAHTVGTDAQTQKLLKTAIRQYLATPSPTSSLLSSDTSHNTQKPQPSKIKRRPKFLLKDGTKLIRSWNGHTYEVTVLDNGTRFKFHDKIYRSLTIIAKFITGTHWSGPRFFGLSKLKETSS